ncbi:sodium/hydrogen exchanger 6 [Tanacetum coccineum]
MAPSAGSNGGGNCGEASSKAGPSKDTNVGASVTTIDNPNDRGLNRSPKQKEVRQVMNDNNLSVCAILESHAYVAVVYDTYNYYVDRHALWNNLAGHASLMHDKPWVLLGYFNAALNLEDHSGGGYEPNIAIREFKECVQKIEVMDVNATGLHFTWNQKPKGSNGMLKKIDRIMCNIPFTNDFSGSLAIFQSYRISDNSPCMLRIPKNLNVNGCVMYRVVKRLKGLKTPLHKLLHDQEASLDEERFLRQQSKIEWLNAGDSNMAYFHKIVKSKCAHNRIKMVWDSSNVLHEGNVVVSAFVSHYEQFLGLEGTITPLDDHRLFSRVLSNHKAEFMVSEVSASEIKGALFYIGDGKAPGSYGFIVAFFKKYWDILGGKVMWIPLNIDLTTLLRVVANMNRFTQTTGETMIKNTIILTITSGTKYMNNGTKSGMYNSQQVTIAIRDFFSNGYLRDLVSINQSAIVPSRRILDNILLTQELMRNYHQKSGPPRCAFKLTFRRLMTRLIGDSLDDLFLFARGHPNSVWVIMDALEEFKNVLGLVLSIPKSTTFFCNVLNPLKDNILSSMPFAEYSLQLRTDVVDWYHVVWFPHCIPRHAIYMWLMIKEKLKTQDRLRQWDVHAFTGMSSVPPCLVDVLAFLIPTKGSSVSNFLSRIVLAATTYWLWNERNSRLFKKKKSNANQIVLLITSLVRLKLVTFKLKKMATGSHLLLLQWKIPSSYFDHDGSSR